MNREELKQWWAEAQENAKPALGAAAVVKYVQENGEADLDELRELLTDQGVHPGEQLNVLAGLVSQGALRERDGTGGLSYALGGK